MHAYSFEEYIAKCELNVFDFWVVNFINIRGQRKNNINWAYYFIHQTQLYLKFTSSQEFLFISIYIGDMGIAGLNLKFNKKVKTNVERESIFIIKSHQTGPQFQKTQLLFSDDKT